MITRGDATTGPAARDLLGAAPDPPCYRTDTGDLALPAPDPAGGQPVRVWARLLSGMQKEALVATREDAPVWRLASDEGPYLHGFDAAPCPLAFMTVGMVAAYLEALRRTADERDVPLDRLTVRLDNRYTMDGSALQGTMRGGALAPALEIRTGTPADPGTVAALVETALRRAPVHGLLGARLTSRFTLTVNGRPVPAPEVPPVDGPPLPDPTGPWPRPAASAGDRIVTRLQAVVPTEGVEGGTGSSLRAEQRRELQVRGIGRLRADGVKEIEQQLHRPLGSTFRFLSDEAPERGGAGRAPDAASYMAAGVAFCFMTQLGRYAAIVRRDLSGYRVVQDTRVRPGDAGTPGAVDAIQTHVHLDTTDTDAFARRCLEMGRQTCFLHALAATALEPVVSVSGSRPESPSGPPVDP